MRRARRGAPAIDVEDLCEQVRRVQARRVAGGGGGGRWADDDVGAVRGDVVLHGDARVGADLRRRRRPAWSGAATTRTARVAIRCYLPILRPHERNKNCAKVSEYCRDIALKKGGNLGFLCR